MSLLEPDLAPILHNNFGRWFLFGGLLGVAVGALLFVPSIFDSLGDGVLIIFPTSIMGLAEPHTLGEKVTVLLVEFVSQFLLYALLSLGFGICIHTLRTLASSSKR